MSYVKHILLPGELVYYDGHVHPRVLMPGVLLIGLAAWLLSLSEGTGGGYSVLIGLIQGISNYIPFFYKIYHLLIEWQNLTPKIALEIKIVALGIALWGLYKFMFSLAIIITTELVVTDMRIIAKTGVFTITTIEMDKRRVAGVTVDQSLLGRLLDYGDVYIQGFTSSIGGLPPMVNPHLLERYIM